jgi:hypothetical protein
MVSKNSKKTKMGIFTYSGNDVRSVTKIFTKYNVMTAFWTTNTLGMLLKPTEEKSKYESSVVYKFKYLACQGLYRSNR